MLTHPLHVYHVDFDSVIKKVLVRDRAAVIVFVVYLPQPSFVNRNCKSKSNMRTCLRTQPPIDVQAQLMNRIFSVEHEETWKKRIIFYYPRSMDNMIRVISVAQVMLDPFPVSSLFAPYLGLSLGVPVVTIPTENLSGRYALGLYKLMDVYLSDRSESLIATTVEQYINIAVMLLHKPNLRDEISHELLRRKKLLLKNQSASQISLRNEWLHFLERIRE